MESLPLVPGFHDRWLTFTPDSTGKLTRIVTAVDGERFSNDWLSAVERADGFGR